ncbi:ABC transporter substrate-binding protein [Amycolatopsis suaedae]|uniref:ABC transporter substrate-binding protein n=1 Tax=Amycolatopsis suaedae TaxID=2510978 RepID=A0A4Q7J7I7_9PSEU|nr:ABC transporter substrate-binding protein [Amycolatopsis suaedae]
MSAVAVVAASALVLSGCGGGEGSGSGGTEGTVTIFNGEPENPLIPGNTTEAYGQTVIDPMFTGLIEYNPDTAEPYNAVAESIQTTDSKVFKVKLKPGWKFHDGTDVKAKNFVDAWNWTAYGPNATQGASFFSAIQGYDEVHPKDPDGTSGPQKAPQPAVDKMSGLKVIDDLNFEITLSKPFSVFPTTVGYGVFSPLPDAFFADRKAYEAKPIGNGPMKFDSREVNSFIKLTRNDDYQGEDKVKFKDLVLKVYQSREAAYSDLIDNNLDFIEELPTSALAGQQFRRDLGERVVEKDSLIVQQVSFPFYRKPYDNPDLRKAISMAIDRDTITKQIFDGTRTPSDGWVHPLIKGYRPGQCGEFCTFDPVKAKEYLARSGHKGPIQMQTNVDGGHKEWAEAVCNSVKNALNTECQFVQVTDFNEHRRMVNAREMVGMYRSGWIADYPSIENFLNPLVKTGGSSNDGEYSNPAVDAKLDEADRAPSEAQAIELYAQAEKMVAQDMPIVPLWSQKTQGGRSDRLKTAKLDAFRKLDLTSVELA